MATVGQFYGMEHNYPSIVKHPLVLGVHLVGVEIELENIRGQLHSRFWEQKEDGSLRNNGAEFVCRGAWGGRDLYTAILEMDTYLAQQEPDPSWRCSTHVHVDVRDMTVKQIKNLILLYTIFEKLLFELSGNGRYKNNFCPAFGYAQTQLRTLSRFWHVEDDRFFSRIRDNWSKYSSMNLLPMGRFGSVEFRIAEATFKKGSLLRLCNRYLALKELAVEWDERPYAALIEHVAESSPHAIFKRGLPRKLDNYQYQLETGMKLAGDILAFTSDTPPSPQGRPTIQVFDTGSEVPDSFVFHDPRGAWGAICGLLRDRHNYFIPEAWPRGTPEPIRLEYRHIQPICDTLSIDRTYFFGEVGEARYAMWLRHQLELEEEFIDDDEDDYDDDSDSEAW